jgi:small-conductance mechanosensitive channel
VPALVGAVLGSAGVAGLVLGFAFKDIAENYVAGILLSLRRPFAPGDHVVIDRVHEGRVVALTSRSTLLMTLDGSQIALPNALVFKSVVMNYTQNPKRRFDFLVPLDPSSSVGDAQREGLAAVARVDGVLAEPAPYALVNEFLHDKLNVQFFGWVDQRRNSLNRVRSEAMRAAKTAIDDAGIRRAGVPIGAISPHPPTAPADTSVDRDIDQQLAEAQRASDADNLLDPANAEARP